MRSSRALLTSIENSRWSSACSFTADWTKITLFSGSSPAASQSSTMSWMSDWRFAVSSKPVVSMCQSATMWKFCQPSFWSRTQFSSAPT